MSARDGGEPPAQKSRAGHHIECSLIHGPILQGFHPHNNGKRHEAVHLIPRNWPAAAPVAWRRPAQGFGLLGAVCTDAASALLRSRAWMTLNIVGTRNSVAQVAKSRPPITARPSGAFWPGSIAIGAMPMIIASAVISTGRNRVLPASRAAARRPLRRERGGRTCGSLIARSPA